MSAADDAAPVSVAEANRLFGPLVHASGLVLAVSGGPDSTALLVLAARWRRALKKGPKLLAVTIDHGLRPESAAEASAVGRLARRLGVPHRILRWEGKKPAAGLQEAARDVRYRLLAAAASRAKADCVLTAHTLDDQAETVLFRLSRGSGLSGLCAMAQVSLIPAGAFPGEGSGIVLVRPLLEVPKARLVATLEHAQIDFAIDPSNRDPRFTRARLRDVVMPALAREGLDARRFALLARRMRRADAAIEMAVGAAAAALSEAPWSGCGPIAFDAEKFTNLPAEVALRLLGRAIAHAGDAGMVQLGKLEALYAEFDGANASDQTKSIRLRRTLGGALVTLTEKRLMVERAPARRAGAVRGTLTTGRYGGRASAKPR